MQWKCLPVPRTVDGKAQIHYTTIYRVFAKWTDDGSLKQAFIASVRHLASHRQLDLSILHGDGTNTVAKQTVDEKTGDLTVKQALTRAAKANVDRLEVLADFKRLIAPFDGIVTTRNTDVGALINADSSAGLALFVISDTQKLRVNVSIPQNYVPAVKINTKVQITVPEYPGKIYYGVVEASARAVDAQSGTTRMQLVVDNGAGELMPGAFANTRIELPATLRALSIPAGALIFGQQGLRQLAADESTAAGDDDLHGSSL
jgi:RND family efflux transporter MFP subunit